MMPFINPWSWYIYNDEMPTLYFGKLTRNEWLVLLFYVVLTILYILGMIYLPSYMLHIYNSPDIFGLTVISLTIVYVVLLLTGINLSYKIKDRKHKSSNLTNISEDNKDSIK